MNKKFTPQNPAKNIHELIAYLKDSEEGIYSYRGQIKHYDAIIPSRCRNLFLNRKNNLTPHIWDLDESKIPPKQVEIIKLKERFRAHLTALLGVGIGNIIAQQYGLGSEALDITSSIEVAAFFATHKYPEYSHYSGVEENELGVIYRFKLGRKMHDLEDLNYRLGSLCHFNEHLNMYIWFDSFRKASLDLKDLDKKIIDYFNIYGQEEACCHNYALLVDYQSCSQFTKDAINKAYGLSNFRFTNTRLARQKGGFIRPPLYFNCILPKEKDVIEAEILLDRNYYEPGFVLAKKLVGISGIENYPEMESFFFQHGDDEVNDITREYLWPSVEEDEIYNQLINVAHMDVEIYAYLETNDLYIDHISQGILDRGFCSGDEDITYEIPKKYYSGNYSDVINLGKKAVELNPNNEITYQYIAASHIKLTNYIEAKNFYKKAIDICPNNTNSYVGLSSIHYELGQIDLAIEFINKAITYNENRSESYYQKGILLSEKEDYQSAIDSFLKALESIKFSGGRGFSMQEIVESTNVELVICYHKMNNYTERDRILNEYFKDTDIKEKLKNYLILL